MQAMWTPSEAQIDSALVSRFMHDISESEREKLFHQTIDH